MSTEKATLEKDQTPTGAVTVTPSVSNFASFAGNGTQQVIAATGDEAGNAGYATNTVTVQLVTNAQYGYSAAGCVTSMVFSGSGFTNTTTLTWDTHYQMTEVRTNGGACERNGFDALGRRVWNWDGTATNYFVYDGIQVIADLNATGGLIRSYTWGPGIDNLLAMTVYTGATAVTYYPLTDHQGTIHALVNSAGSVVESYRFDAWGRVLGIFDSASQPITESSVGNRYLWQGREYSWKTGLYFFRARWYDPITGRWLSNDPIGISGGLNQYVFCANNPVNFVDPFGLEVRDPNPTEWADIHAAIDGIKGYKFAPDFGDRLAGHTYKIDTDLKVVPDDKGKTTYGYVDDKVPNTVVLAAFLFLEEPPVGNPMWKDASGKRTIPAVTLAVIIHEDMHLQFPTQSEADISQRCPPADLQQGTMKRIGQRIVEYHQKKLQAQNPKE